MWNSACTSIITVYLVLFLMPILIYFILMLTKPHIETDISEITSQSNIQMLILLSCIQCIRLVEYCNSFTYLFASWYLNAIYLIYHWQTAKWLRLCPKFLFDFQFGFRQDLVSVTASKHIVFLWKGESNHFPFLINIFRGIQHEYPSVLYLS